MNVSFTSLAVILFGLLLVGFGLTVTYGVIGARSAWVQHTRAAYAHRAPSMTWAVLSPSRMIVLMPVFGILLLLLGIGIMFGRSTAVWFFGAAVVPLVLMVVGLIWPTPFLPKWAREADARHKAGLEPTMPPPPELAAYRATPRWQWLAMHAAAAVLVTGNLMLDVNPRLTGPLLMGWAFLAAAHARARSNR
jgi:hypothetical protein